MVEFCLLATLWSFLANALRRYSVSKRYDSVITVRTEKEVITNWIKAESPENLTPPQLAFRVCEKIVGASVNSCGISPGILLVIPGESRQILGFLIKGTPKQDRTKTDNYETLGVGRNN